MSVPAWKQRKFERGECLECENTVVSGFRRCAFHNEENNKRNRHRRQQYKTRGVCIHCGKNPAIKGRSLCLVCATADSESHTRRYHTDVALKDATIQRVLAVEKERKENGLCVKCGEKTEPGVRRCAKHRASWNKRAQRERQSLRDTVLDHYGPRCFCCGETIKDFLTIDHKNNDGGRHRKLLSGSNKSKTDLMYRQIIALGFPDWIQIACMNCNWARARRPGNICPHEEARRGTEKRGGDMRSAKVESLSGQVAASGPL
jgi:hypothetical protein